MGLFEEFRLFPFFLQNLLWKETETGESLWNLFQGSKGEASLNFLTLVDDPSVADFFYLAGYPFLFAFSIFYLLPLRKAISRKLIIATSLLSVALFIPTIILVYENSSSENIPIPKRRSLHLAYLIQT